MEDELDEDHCSQPENPPNQHTGFYTRDNLAQLRVKRDIQELATQRLVAQSASTTIEFPLGSKNVMQLKVKVCMDENGGIYGGGTFLFQLDIPSTYPFHAPQVTCLTRTWHPSIDLNTGEVRLAIFGTAWRPVLSINNVIFCLQLLFVEPNPEHPCNLHAAETLMNDPSLFQDQVRQSMYGGQFFGLTFESVLMANVKRKSTSLESICRLTEESMRLDSSEPSTKRAALSLHQSSSRSTPSPSDSDSNHYGQTDFYHPPSISDHTSADSSQSAENFRYVGFGFGVDGTA